jgi:hypothetical protein
MINKTKLALIAAVAVAGFTSPALAQSFDNDYGTGNVLPFNYHSTAPETAVRHAGVHAARRDGLHAFAMEPEHTRRTGLHAYAMETRHARRTELHTYTMDPRPQSAFDSESPAATGGGSIGYNELLMVEP